MLQHYKFFKFMLTKDNQFRFNMTKYFLLMRKQLGDPWTLLIFKLVQNSYAHAYAKYKYDFYHAFGEG